MTITATTRLAYTSSREDNARRNVRRIAAAARRATERAAEAAEREAEREARRPVVEAWVEDLRAAGAVLVGTKIIDDGGKYRLTFDLTDVVDFLVRSDAEIEAWGINEAGEFVGEVF